MLNPGRFSESCPELIIKKDIQPQVNKSCGMHGRVRLYEPFSDDDILFFIEKKCVE